MLRMTLFALATLTPISVFAAGSEDSTPPKPTATTEVCKEGYVYDDAKKACVAPQESSLNDDQRYQAVRELAYAGRYADAQLVLAAMNPSDDRTMTYWGFTHRKLGNTDLAMGYYSQAIAQNPNNLLARSYMGQAHAVAGQTDLARAQLREIKARGGTESWPAKSLSWAIKNGQGFSY